MPNPIPKWCPPHLRPLIPGRRRLTLTAVERRILRKRRPISVSAWAERHRRVHESVYPGPWSNDTAPYLTAIMDAADLPHVEEVIILKCPQSGGTEAAYNFLAHKIDRSPGPTMFVFPDESLCADNAHGRIIPMLKSSPKLRRYLTGAADDLSAKKIRLVNMTIHMAWSHSPSSLANKPIRWMFLDEIDKYPDTSGKRETSPIFLAEQRQNTYRSAGKSKCFKLSTPTTESGNIWLAYQCAQVRFDYWVRCPECDREQLMRFGRVKWDEQYHRDPEKIRAAKGARYSCPGCSAMWDDSARDAAVLRGRWRLHIDIPPDADTSTIPLDPLPTAATPYIWEYLSTHRPRSIAFHVPALISPFVLLSESAAAFFQGIGNKIALRNFANNIEAKPWKEFVVERPPDRLMTLRDDRPSGRVPGDASTVAALVAGCDTQVDGFFFSLFAVGYGFESDLWLVRYGYVDSFAALAAVLWRDEYRDSTGNLHTPMMSLIDAMGDKTAEVYDFCRQHRGLISPLKGERTMSSPHAYTNLEYYPGGVKLIPGGLRLVRVNTNHYKNLLSNKMDITKDDPGSIRLHSQTDLEYCRHLSAEYVDEKGFWTCPQYKKNHYWDCLTYAAAAADILGVRYWPRPGEAVEPAREEIPANPPSGRRPGWLGHIRR